MTTFKIHRVSFNKDNVQESIDALERLLNDGWVIDRCDRTIPATGDQTTYCYGPLLYFLSKEDNSIL